MDSGYSVATTTFSQYAHVSRHCVTDEQLDPVYLVEWLISGSDALLTLLGHISPNFLFFAFESLEMFLVSVEQPYYLCHCPNSQ